MEWSIYILLSLKNGQTYKGLTNNLERRLAEHERGRVRSTKGWLPLKLVHVELVHSRSEARTFEKYFKSGFGREIINEIIEQRSLPGW